MLRTAVYEIPENLVVGFQKRSECKNELLAYITYRRDGKLAKEKSWNDWKSDDIPTKEIANTPRTGFKLNGYGGGVSRYSWNWEMRNEFVRISHPEGFDFEIPLGNFMMLIHSHDLISEELTGSYILAWNGTTLLLIPEESDEYKESIKERTKSQEAKGTITNKTLVPGTKYRFKGFHKEDDMIYLGEFEVLRCIKNTKYKGDSTYYKEQEEYQVVKRKYHVFAEVRKWDFQKEPDYHYYGFNSINGKISFAIEEVTPEKLNSLVNRFKSRYTHDGPIELMMSSVPTYKKSSYCSTINYLKVTDETHGELISDYGGHYGGLRNTDSLTISGDKLVVRSRSYLKKSSGWRDEYEDPKASPEDIKGAVIIDYHVPVLLGDKILVLSGWNETKSSFSYAEKEFNGRALSEI